MQNWFLYHLVSGSVWFLCGVLYLLIIAFDVRGFYLPRPLLRACARLLLLLLMALAALSGTPLPPWLVVALPAVAAAHVVLGFGNKQRWLRWPFGGGVAILTVVALIVELPYHVLKPLDIPTPNKVYIIGDSLAAGMGGEKVTWPKKLRELTRAEIRDLSFAGAKAESAYKKQASIIEQDADPAAWVLICIGGNDMLGRTPPDEFGQQLDRLLARARGAGDSPRTVLMMELAIIPGAWSFAAWQRDLAAKHGVHLIPKRLLAGLVLTDANVLDGVHLSQAGHELMAEQTVRWLGNP